MKIINVYGSPMSGKTTYVNGVRKSGDIVYDFDVIMAALTGMSIYEKNQLLIGQIEELKYNLIYELWCEESENILYIISCNKVELEEWLNIEHVLIDTTYDECIDRLNKCDDHRALRDDYKDIIFEWFSRR